MDDNVCKTVIINIYMRCVQFQKRLGAFLFAITQMGNSYSLWE